MIKPNKIFSFCAFIFLCAAIFLMFSCQKNENAGILSISNDGISTTEDEPPLNETIKKIHDSHRGRCPSKVVAGMKMYNKAWEIIQWIQNKRGLKFEEFPPVCALSKEDIIKIQSRSFAKEELPAQDQRFPGNGSLEMENEDYSPGYYSNRTIFVEKDHPLEIAIVVHELTHALQDQHYVIEAFQNPEDIVISLDESNARESVIEGEASLMQHMYMAETGKGGPLSPNSVQTLIEGQLKVFENSDSPSPAALLNTFIYQIGMRFILSLLNYEYDPGVLNTLFDSPPLSTDEVFFPQKYIDKKPFYPHFAFDTGLLDDFFESYDFKRLKMNELAYGKLNLSMTVKNIVKASDIFLKDLGWNGDRQVVYAKSSNKQGITGDTVLLNLCKWDSAEDAYVYASYLDEMVNGKFKNFEEFEKVFEDDTISEFSYLFRGKKYYTLIKVKNDRLVYVENLPDFMLANLRMLESRIFDFFTDDWVS